MRSSCCVKASRRSLTAARSSPTSSASSGSRYDLRFCRTPSFDRWVCHAGTAGSETRACTEGGDWRGLKPERRVFGHYGKQVVNLLSGLTEFLKTPAGEPAHVLLLRKI